MAICRECGEFVDLPFICGYCGGSHCTQHRIPESHNCPGLLSARSPPPSKRINSKLTSGVSKGLKIHEMLGGNEAQEILVAWLILSFCFSAGALMSLGSFIGRFTISLLTVGLGFVLHELAHRYVARKYACLSRFRIWPLGLALALILALVSRGNWVFAAPGAVYIIPRNSRGISRRENGIISLSGIVVNLLLALVFIAVSSLGSLAESLGRVGATINLWLAAFNLIPFSQLDGAKVMAWSWKIWTVATALAWLGLLLLA
jgi:Zn-dependent protease